MRAFVVLCVVATLAHADPIRTQHELERLAEATRADKPKDRRDAAVELAARTATSDEARDIVMRAVITDDREVRSALLDALVARKAFAMPAAIWIPSLTVLAKQLSAFTLARVRSTRTRASDNLFGARKGASPTAKQCRIVDADPRGATLECRASACRSACIHVQTKLTLRTGKLWTLVDQHTTANDDGACGFCE